MKDIVSPQEERPEFPLHEEFRTHVLREVAAMERELTCRIGFAMRDRDLPLHVMHRADDLFHPASTMKVPVMIEVFRQADAGIVSLDHELVLDPICRSILDDSPFHCEPAQGLSTSIGQAVTLRELVRAMITESDNLATNLLISLCKPQKVTASMRALGAHEGYVLRGVMDEKAFDAGLSNRLSARDLTTLMAAIDSGNAASPESCQEMRDILLDQKHRLQIPALLPPDVKVANKTGSITANRHDTAIVSDKHFTYYLTILVDEFDDDEAVITATAELSRAVYEGRKRLGAR